MPWHDAGVLLEATTGHVDVAGVDLTQVGDSSGLVAGDEGRARAPEEVEHAGPRPRGVVEASLDERDRLHGRVLLGALGPRAVDHRDLRVVAIPARPVMRSPTWAARSRQVAIQERLVDVVVVRVAEHHLVPSPADLSVIAP